MRVNDINEHASPLDREQARCLNELVKSLSADQAQWISGYLAGLNAAGAGEAGARVAPSATEKPTITILYGSETGNAERIAEQFRAQAEDRGLNARALDMADYKPRDLKKEQCLVLVTATHGEGDPPDPAEEFHEFLHSRKAPGLAGVPYAVLGLGDSSYEHFCQTGKDFDARLAELGAERLHDRVDCDVDYDEPAAHWTETVLKRLGERFDSGGEPGPNVVAIGSQARTRQPSAFGRDNPFPAEVLDNLKITGRGSNKEIRHIELSLADSGLSFEPGDALSIVARNHDEVIFELLEAVGLEGSEVVPTPRGEQTLEEALRHDYEITTVTPPFLGAYAEFADSDELNRLLEPDNAGRLTEYRWGRHIVDVVRDFSARELDAKRFVTMLRKLQPRDYSIASSYNANPDEVHLTVAAVRYRSHGRERHGVASTYLSDRVEPGETVPVYVQRNKNFKLPADDATPIIMIGPGTGVAPFRAFVEEREHRGADGRNWLFFGEQHFRTDFLYQTDWQRWLRDGILTRMDVAFSRDTENKVYVQHRLLENARDLYAWIQDGAHLYVCGDADRMAPDVHEALTTIIAEQGGMSADKARDYLKSLQREKRYQRDVY
jgi:sulfite reductase (NADPH) flavoprotein alpha-component